MMKEIMAGVYYFFFSPKNRMGSQDFYQLLSVLLSKGHVM